MDQPQLKALQEHKEFLILIFPSETPFLPVEVEYLAPRASLAQTTAYDQADQINLSA